MLNEAWQAWKALDSAKIIPIHLPHPLIWTLPTSEKNLLKVRLNKKGSVTTIEDVADDERTGMWRIVQTSEGSFPVIKVNLPFLNLPKEYEIWERISKLKKEDEKLNLLNSTYNQFGNSAQRIWKDAGWSWNVSLEKAQLIIKKLGEQEGSESIVNLSERFKLALQSESKFISEIAKCALTQMRTGRLNSLKTIQELLVGKGKDNIGNDKKISVLLALEQDNGESIYQNQVQQAVADVLPTNLASKKREHHHSADYSAFSGEGDLLMEPFPQIKLPVLNSKFPLLSMASDADKAKCNERYGLTEYITFPVTSLQSRRMAGVLEWLLSPNKEGKTWRSVANGKFEIDPKTHRKRELKDLLIIYVNEKPDLDAKTASYFGSGVDVTAAKFEADSKAVCDALNAVIWERPKSRLNLCLIRKVSDGQAHIVLSESLSVKGVLYAVERWQQAVQENTPVVTLYLQPYKTFDKKDIPAVKDARPFAPYPDQVVKLLSYQWLRDGSSPQGNDGSTQQAKQAIVGPGLGEVLALMLRIEGKWESAALRMLDLLIRRVEPMLVGLFGAKHAYGPRQNSGNHEPFFDYPRPSRETALQVVSVLGILLDALASRKEDYMKEASYQVGQVLSLADTLHKDYCIVVRNGQLPNSLVGTSLVRRALDSPAGALADLSERILEYIRWAKVAQISPNWPQGDQRFIAVNEARKKLRQYQSLANALGACDLPKECNDVMKAHMLLGFLADQP